MSSNIGKYCADQDGRDGGVIGYYRRQGREEVIRAVARLYGDDAARIVSLEVIASKVRTKPQVETPRARVALRC